MTNSTSRRPRQRRSTDTCRLTLHLRGTAYRVRPVASDDGRAFRLRKADGTIYDVAETPFGPTCDCGDQVWRHEGRDGTGCKHIQALRKLGLIGDPAPRPAARTDRSHRPRVT
jgi:hypothetical protein